MTNLGGDQFPDNLTYEQAVAFLERRGWMRMLGENENPECTSHNRRHPIGFGHISVGVYNGFDTEREVIEWVARLIPNSL